MPLIHAAIRRHFLATAVAVGLAALLACGAAASSLNSPNNPSSTATGKVAVVITDCPSDQWAEIGVIVRSIALVPKGQAASTAVQVYDGSQDTVQTNLVDLDSLGSLLSKATLPEGTYDRVLVKIDAKPTTIILAPSLDASGNAQNAIPSSQIEVNGIQDGNGWVNLPLIRLQADLQIVTGQTTAVQLDFDLSHPLFVVAHNEPGGTTTYVLTFQVRHKPHVALHKLNLHHNLGQVTAIAADAKSFTLRTLHQQDLSIQLDPTNGTLFFDLDTPAGVPTILSVAPALLSAGKYAKVQTRFQNDGSLYAVRVWFSADQTKLPKFTPEGHVVGVDLTAGTVLVLNGDGRPTLIQVNDATQFFFQGATTAIGSGKAFLSKVYRDFKVQVIVADPLAVPPVATAIDIQHGNLDGAFQNATTDGFSYQKAIWAHTDTTALGYGSGFSWWNFAFPTTASTDLTSFIAKANATGTNLRAFGASTLDWDATNAKWVALDAIFIPSQVSVDSQLVSAGYASGAMTISYAYRQSDGTLTPTTLVVNLSSATGAETIVTEFSRRALGTVGDPLVGVSAVLPANWPTKLATGAKVRVFGIPKGDGTLDAYVVNIFK